MIVTVLVEHAFLEARARGLQPGVAAVEVAALHLREEADDHVQAHLFPVPLLQGVVQSVVDCRGQIHPFVHVCVPGLLRPGAQEIAGDPGCRPDAHWHPRHLNSVIRHKHRPGYGMSFPVMAIVMVFAA